MTDRLQSYFTQFVLNFYERYGRHDLPWRQGFGDYEVLVSEVMLQQTQVERVIPKYQNFIKTFPNFNSLAQAKQSEVLQQWVGLGYNRRALYLQKAAQQIISEYNGKLPSDLDQLKTIAGIGPYTAAALQAFVFNLPSVVIETNIRTVFIYHFFPEKEKVKDEEIVPLIQQTLPKNKARVWYSALMDYGTYLKKVLPNPNQKSNLHTKQATFHGSLRQARGAVVRELVNNHHLSQNLLLSSIKLDQKLIIKALEDLEKECFLTIQDGTVSLN